jgi:carbamoyltransferase
MKILGISAFYHDSAASIIHNNEIIACAQEERFTREKHTPNFPSNAIKYCLQESGLTIGELDAIVFYDKPLIKFERLLSTFYAVAPKGLLQFLKAIPIWLKEKLFLKKLIIDNLKEIDGNFKTRQLKLLFTEHHLSHAASTFYPSNFNKSAILTIDGVGEWATASIGIGEDKKISILKELYFPHSLGLLYSSFTFFLGFRVNSGEYKLMGLAPYGNPQSKETKIFIKKIKENLVDIKEDGSIFLNLKFFKYTYGLKMVNDKLFNQLFNLKRRDEDDEITQQHCNLAYAIQKVTEEIVVKMAKEAKRITGSENLCLAGGVALNCVANGVLHSLGIFKNIYIQPASGDAGGALGCALTINHDYFDQERNYSQEYDLMNGSYLGPYFSSKEIHIMNKKNKTVFKSYDDFGKLSIEVANLIANGNVIGWFQDRSEFGPRALGNRSILADPRNPDMQKKLNLKIKYREGFRPFAPSVLEEDYDEYFEGNLSSPYMLYVKKLKDTLIKKLPENYQNLDYWDKLYTQRSNLQSITHVDFSARIQTVSKKTNIKYWNLINNFKKITGVAVLVNTSFNVRGEPIVDSPQDAFNCFMNTEMDYLVIENYLYKKSDQPMVKKNFIFKKD